MKNREAVTSLERKETKNIGILHLEKAVNLHSFAATLIKSNRISRTERTLVCTLVLKSFLT